MREESELTMENFGLRNSNNLSTNQHQSGYVPNQFENPQTDKFGSQPFYQGEEAELDATIEYFENSPHSSTTFQQVKDKKRSTLPVVKSAKKPTQNYMNIQTNTPMDTDQFTDIVGSEQPVAPMHGSMSPGFRTFGILKDQTKNNRNTIGTNSIKLHPDSHFNPFDTFIQFESKCSTSHAFNYFNHNKSIRKSHLNEFSPMHVQIQTNNKVIFFQESTSGKTRNRVKQHKVKYLDNMREYGCI